MVSFDLAYSYQFGLFFREDAEFAPEAVDKLAETMNAQVEGVKGHGLRLSVPESEQAFVVRAGVAAPTTTLTWKSGVWRMVFSSERLDVHFDAKAYADVREETPLPLAEVRRRIVPNFGRVSDVLQQKPNRLALLVAGKAKADLRSSTAEVARMFLRSDIVDDDLRDTIVRVNRGARWRLGNIEQAVNRNETASSVWALRNGVEETTLSWQLDVNTSPLGTKDAEYELSDIATFFDRADEWINGRLTAIRGTT